MARRYISYFHEKTTKYKGVETTTYVTGIGMVTDQTSSSIGIAGFELETNKVPTGNLEALVQSSAAGFRVTGKPISTDDPAIKIRDIPEELYRQLLELRR